MQVVVHVEGRTTHVEVTASSDSPVVENIVGVGSASCAADDHYVPKIGESIALARALRSFADQLESRWDARVVTKAELAERKQRKAAARPVVNETQAPDKTRTVEV